MDIMRGDAYPVYITLTQAGEPLTPDMISEMEVCVGRRLRRLYSAGEVKYDEEGQRWYIQITQRETLGMAPGPKDVVVRVKYQGTGDGDVVGVKVGDIIITDTTSEEVL